MSEQSQIVFMQVRLIRLAAKQWNTDIQRANALMQRYGLLEFIAACFDTFHTEGDQAVLSDLEMVLKHKGGDIVAELGS